MREATRRKRGEVAQRPVHFLTRCRPLSVPRARRLIEFFTANIRNRNTRMAYARAVKKFFDWCDKRKLELEEIDPLSVAAYIEQLGVTASKPTVKQHLVAIRKLFDT
jgi:integrase/recombinase XerD